MRTRYQAGARPDMPTQWLTTVIVLLLPAVGESVTLETTNAPPEVAARFVDSYPGDDGRKTYQAENGLFLRHIEEVMSGKGFWVIADSPSGSSGVMARAASWAVEPHMISSSSPNARWCILGRDKKCLGSNMALRNVGPDHTLFLLGPSASVSGFYFQMGDSLSEFRTVEGKRLVATTAGNEWQVLNADGAERLAVARSEKELPTLEVLVEATRSGSALWEVKGSKGWSTNEILIAMASHDQNAAQALLQLVNSRFLEPGMFVLHNSKLAPLVSYGTGELLDAGARKGLPYALQAKYKAIDSAWVYRTEQAVADVLKQESVSHQQVAITSKVWATELGVDETRAAVERSLGLLDSPYIDLMYLHHMHARFIRNLRIAQHLKHGGKPGGHWSACMLKNFIDIVHGDAAVMDLARDYGILFQSAAGLSRFVCTEETQPCAYGVQPRDADKMGYPKVRAKLDALGSHLGKSSVQLSLKLLMQLGTGILPRSATPDHIAENSFDQLTGWALDASQLDLLVKEAHGSQVMLKSVCSQSCNSKEWNLDDGCIIYGDLPSCARSCLLRGCPGFLVPADEQHCCITHFRPKAQLLSIGMTYATGNLAWPLYYTRAAAMTLGASPRTKHLPTKFVDFPKSQEAHATYGTTSCGIFGVVCLGALATLVIGLGHYRRKQPSTKL